MIRLDYFGLLPVDMNAPRMDRHRQALGLVCALIDRTHLLRPDVGDAGGLIGDECLPVAIHAAPIAFEFGALDQSRTLLAGALAVVLEVAGDIPTRPARRQSPRHL